MTGASACRFDHAVLSAWEHELKAAHDPCAMQQCLAQAPELLPRFATHYQRLKALSRPMRRRLQRQWKRSLGGLALLLALGQAPALAATINVGGACTLVEAIGAANTDTPSGGCAAGSGADSIRLAPGSLHRLTAVNNSDFGPTGLPVIRSTLTIVGNGAIISRGSPGGEDPNLPPFRIFALGNGSTVTIQNTTITGGDADSGTLDPSAVNSGGGVLIAGNSTLTLDRSAIAGNFAFYYGGGLNVGSGSTLHVINSTITGNSSGSNGGGLAVYKGNATLTNTTVTGNASNSFGGGINLYSGSTLTLFHSIISGNVALRRPFERTPDEGEEIDNYGSTIRAGRFNVIGLEGAAGVSDASQTDPNPAGFTPGPTDIVPTQGLSQIINPKVGVNGGTTLTHALVTGSPAIDAVNDGTCPLPAVDQRGLRRPQDGNGDGGPACDSGAFEFVPPGSATPTAQPPGAQQPPSPALLQAAGRTNNLIRAIPEAPAPILAKH